MATKQVTVGTAQVTLLKRDEARSAILICNTHATAIAYVSDSGSVSTTDGHAIMPKTTLLLSYTEGIEVEKKIVAISDTADTIVTVWEWFKRKKEELPDVPDVQEPGAADPGM